jgi:CHAD domain-containing protein
MAPAARALNTVVERIEGAAEVLGSDRPLPERVHDARRELKKARAGLRLLSGALRKKPRRELNLLCRDAARLLRPARDGASLESSWNSLRLDQAGDDLLLRRRRNAERALSLDAGLKPCLKSLTLALWRARRLALSRKGQAVLDEGLARARERLAAAAAGALRLRTDAAYHEWRKRAKDLRYQLELLAGLNGSAPGEPVERLKALTDILGEDHDLAELAGFMAGHPQDFGGPSGVRRARGAVEKRRRALHRALKPWKPSRNLKE